MGADEQAQLGRRLERERRARREAEAIAERVTGELYATVQELRRVNAELDAANESIREFVAVASHDMRGPLTSILGFTDLLRGRNADLSQEQRAEFLDVVGEQGRRMQHLVEDMLILSRLEAGAAQAHVEDLLLDREIRRAVNVLGVDVAGVSVASPPDLAVRSDPEHLQRILGNYLGNAQKYGAPPIVVRASEAERWVEIRVADTGPGVPEEFVPRLFGKFARADTESTRRVSGSGLGLSIVRGLALLNDGEVWYEPNRPTGSIFCVRLPKPAA